MTEVDWSRVQHEVTAVEGRRAVWLASNASVRYELLGEEQNPQHMHHIASAVRGNTDVPLVAWLTPDNHNPSAIAIWILEGRVGWLPAQLAHVWQPVFQRLAAQHNAPISCRATLDPPSPANGGGYGIAIWLPEIVPVAPVQNQRVPQAPPPIQKMVPAAAPPVTPLSPEVLAILRADIKTVSAEIESKRRELRAVEESLDIQSFGFYQPKYGFESSAQYVTRLKSIRDDQQAMIKQDKAAPCDTTWTVGGSAKEGKKMVKQQAKLMLRAFNGESDAAIAKVRYDNVTTLEQRLIKAYADINKLGEVQKVFISKRYFDLKLAELHLVHEHREKVQEEKEDQKRIKEQMREEQQALEEIEKAKEQAEKQELASAAALAKARMELEASAATSKQHEKLESLVSRLENELKDALDRKAKAIARAQLTKSGHVYVLSNIGSFGEGVYKIGMTRRLDPYERVDELGDASVPFPFDVHAIIFAEDAPGLETKLHSAFAARRVNGVNNRKEYFRTTLDEIRDIVEKSHGLVTFRIDAEAEQYRKTLAAMNPAPAAVAVAEVNEPLCEDEL